MEIEVSHKSGKGSRSLKVTVNGKRWITPTYFPSVSSQGVRYSVDSYVDLLVEHQFPFLLVSSYDLDRELMSNDLVKKINKFSDNGNILFVDSGMYESTWKRDPNWLFDNYRETISVVKCDLYSSFDIFPGSNEGYSNFMKRTIRAIRKSRALESRGELVPIVHGENPQELFKAVKKVLRAFDFELRIISVPERETGQDIIERARLLRRIRKLLDQQDQDTILHLLGCGDPISLVLFIYCGVDSFDSLDWLKFALDPDELRMRHFSHSVLIDCNCPYCSNNHYSTFFQVLLHNLYFYQGFMDCVGKKIIANEFEDFVENLIKPYVIRKLRL